MPAAFPRSNQNRQAGTLTPRTMNSLTAIAAEQGQEGEEEDWDNGMRGWNGDEVICIIVIASEITYF